MRTVTLIIALGAFWLALSGHYKPLLLGIGAVVVVATVGVAARMRVSDEEGVPIEYVVGVLGYMPWLLLEILKSAWGVTMLIINPKLPISPTMTVIRAKQKNPVGINIFANSITLTPGTVTTGVDGQALTVHAIVKDGADDLEAGGMNTRVAQLDSAKEAA